MLEQALHVIQSFGQNILGQTGVLFYVGDDFVYHLQNVADVFHDISYFMWDKFLLYLLLEPSNSL